MSVVSARRSHVPLGTAGVRAARRLIAPALTRLLPRTRASRSVVAATDAGRRASRRRGARYRSARGAIRRPSRHRPSGRGHLEAVVPGHRLLALHQLHAVPELLPVRRLRRRRRTGKIQVQNQSNCKTDCPACSRVCPEVAIMFPKYRHGPINGDEVHGRRHAARGDEGGHLGAARRRHLLDAARPQRQGEVALLQGARRRPRAQGAAELPGHARSRDLDIPAEVLASLPSPDEIRAKAEAAQAAAPRPLPRRPPRRGAGGA